MSLQRFLTKISSLLPGESFSGDLQALGRLNPGKIYLENVRSILGVSSQSAQRICETAVRQGLFSRGVEVVCPDGAVAASAESEQRLPEIVRCWREANGEYEEVFVSSNKLPRVVFYRLSE
jgi:hypothetical protein